MLGISVRACGELRIALAALALLCAALLCLPVAAAATAPSGGEGRIFFTRDSDPGPESNTDIYAINPDATGLTNLTPGLALSDERWASVDPSGQWVTFASGEVETDIWIMRSNGSGHAPLVTDPDDTDFHPNFSPDGRSIVFVQDSDAGIGSETDLWMIKPDGTGLTQLTNTPDVDETDPSFSPDGTRLAFTVRPAPSEFDIQSMAVNGSDRRPLITATTDDSQPVYSPDGRGIVFRRAPTDQLHIANADGSGIVNLMPTWLEEAFDSDFSPDGKRLVFDDDNQDLFMISSAGGPVSAFTDDSVSDADPSWEHVFRCAGRRATIVGDDGPDKIKGTKKADVIVTNAGKDVVRGRGGNDRVCGGRGKDQLRGNNGRDRLFGQAGADLLSGGRAADALRGGKGKDKERQ